MAELEEGSVIGNYRVIRLLGQGGMGTVYEVEHLELGTHYALKTFTFDPDNDANHALKKKFLEEGKLLARLKHPNLTHVFDLGFEEETQMPYFVMDLVTYEDGETYTVEDIDLKDIDEDMVYGWFKQLASALDYIHGEGIVHRDIKPSNLLVDKDLNVVLTDFGISRIFGQKIKSEVEATRTMVSKTGRGKLVLGTEHYIAPEVSDGEEATPEDGGYLSLTIGKDGNVKASGKLSDGTAVSAASPLVYDEEYGWLAYFYTAPSAYKGGSFAIAVGFDGPRGALVMVDGARWTSRNPQATGVYGEGFGRVLDFSGAYYGKRPDVSAWSRAEFDADSPDGYGFDGVAPKVSVAQATGIFKGACSFLYDGGAKAKKANFEGIVVLGADSLRGFYLWDAIGSYIDPKTRKEKTYKYKESHPVLLTP